MSRLVTERVSRAEATQRTGRAGRVSAGTCYRLWTKGEEGSLPAFAPAEIEAADLAGFALELANWGSTGDDLALLTAPPQGSLEQARDLLMGLGACAIAFAPKAGPYADPCRSGCSTLGSFAERTGCVDARGAY